MKLDMRDGNEYLYLETMFCLSITIVPTISNGRLKNQTFPPLRLYVPSVHPNAHLRQIRCIDADLSLGTTSSTLTKQ